MIRLAWLGLLVAGAGALGCNGARHCSCPPVDDPVCGSDGISYSSACNASCAGTGIRNAGFCGADGPGGCNCTADFDPVCGSDGHTYTNACMAACAGVGIAHAGACTTDGGDGGGDGGPTGLCETDQGCVFVSDSGCCGNCLARTDPVPPPLPCGIACPAYPPACLCLGRHCQPGSLTQGTSCDPARDQCGVGLKCCATCCGVPQDGGFDPHPECVMPLYTPQGPECPPLALPTRP